MSATEVLLDGRRLSSGDLALSRGLHYGDGVFRTCLIFSSEVIDIKRQISKLSEDAIRLELGADAARACAGEAQTLAMGVMRAVLKLLVFRGGEARGYAPERKAPGARRLLLRYPAPAFPDAHWSRGVRLYLARTRCADQPAFAGIKHLNRLENVWAAREGGDDAEEGVMCDGFGRPICGTRSNLFWRQGTHLYTPALTRCGVAGVMRERVMELARAQSVQLRVGEWSMYDLERAEEMFVTNSLIGIWPVREFGTWSAPAPGPLTAKLMQVLRHPRLVQAG